MKIVVAADAVIANYFHMWKIGFKLNFTFHKTEMTKVN